MDAQKLRALAEAATQPGPWTVASTSEGKGRHSYRVLDANGFWVADVDDAKDDAAYIAAVSPDVLVQLLDEIERLQRDQWPCPRCGPSESDPDGDLRKQLAKVRADRDTMIAVHDELEQQLAAAQAECERLRGLVANAAVRDLEWATRLLEACDLFEFKEHGQYGIAKSQRARIAELRRKAEP